MSFKVSVFVKASVFAEASVFVTVNVKHTSLLWNLNNCRTLRIRNVLFYKLLYYKALWIYYVRKLDKYIVS